MARPQASGWTWDRERVQILGDCIEEGLTCRGTASRFNERFGETVPGLALNKDSILKAVKSKIVIDLLTMLYGEVRAQELVALIRRPGGRPKGAKDKRPRVSPTTGRRPRPIFRAPKPSALGAMGFSHPRK